MKINRIIGLALLFELLAGFSLFVAAQNPPGAYNSPAQGGTSSLPAGLTFVAPTLTVSTAGSGNGQLALSGNTSGTATFIAPAVAGTSTNPVTTSNVFAGPNGLVTAPTYGFTVNGGTGIFTNGAGPLLLAAQGSQIVSATNGSFAIAVPASSTSFTANTYLSGTNCSSSASPAVCGSAAAGSFVLAAAATTVTVNTTAVTANSQIIVVNDDSLGTKLSVTCNTALDQVFVSGRVAATSFTITGTAPVTNPNCYSYLIVN